MGSPWGWIFWPKTIQFEIFTQSFKKFIPWGNHVKNNSKNVTFTEYFRFERIWPDLTISGSGLWWTHWILQTGFGTALEPSLHFQNLAELIRLNAKNTNSGDFPLAFDTYNLCIYIYLSVDVDSKSNLLMSYAVKNIRTKTNRCSSNTTNDYSDVLSI